jgi:hypothetical protein
VVLPGLTPILEIILTFIIKTSEVLERSNLNFMKMSAPQAIILFFLTETWLNALCYDHNLFPDCYTVLRSERPSVNKTLGGGVLIALSSRVRSYKRRHNLEYCEECVWVEIPTLDGFNLLIGNHYFPPDAKSENIATYFRFLENYLDTHNFRVIMVADFNTPGFDWKSGLSLSNSHYYSKL